MEGRALHLSQIDADRKKFKGFLDVPYERWSTGTTVADLEKEVASQTGLRVAYIAYRGTRLAKDTLLSSLVLDLDEGACPRFSVHTTSGDNIFFVKSLTGRSVMIDLPLDSSTVSELKVEIQALENIPAKYQRFVYNGHHFADSDSDSNSLSLSPCRNPATKTLRDYGVQRDSTIHLHTRLRGGATDPSPPTIEFSDLQNSTALAVLPWAKSAPVWRYVTKGLNLEGTCTNRTCAAHNQLVICRKGFVAVNLSQEQARCPLCKLPVLVKTCSFTSCTWMYEGRKAATTTTTSHLPPKPSRGLAISSLTHLLTRCFTGKPSIKDEDDDSYSAIEKSSPAGRDIVSAWFRASDKYEYFKQDNNMVQWENLFIVAKKLPTVSKDATNSPVPLDEPCSICFHTFDPIDGRKNHTTVCGHTFHAECVESWLACGGSACPVCRVAIAVEQ